MKRKIIIGVVFLMGIAGMISVLFGRRGNMPYHSTEEQFHTTTEKVKEVEPSGEYIFLQELLSCDEEHAVEIAEIFEDITEKKLENAESVPTSKNGKILKVVTSDKEYYLKINPANTVVEIREDSTTGKVVYLMMY